MVDLSTVEQRLERLDDSLAMLDAIQADGREQWLADRRLQLQGERALQVATQTCIDVGAHLVASLGLGPPSDYADIFERLARGADLDRVLAQRLKEAAGQRNALVRLYLELDPEKVWAGIEAADALHEFAHWALEEAQENKSPPERD